MKYVIITPVRDEAQYVERTVASVMGQTVLPSRWVIVDDGSSDGTASVVSACAKKCDWISLVTLSRGGNRQPGSGVINAFNRGLPLLSGTNFEFIVKLDCDLDLPRDYFERLLREFRTDPTLGIASGAYSERCGDRWALVGMPDYHAAGASKVIRRECFAEIGGFVPARGWDTVDEIRAQLKGWKTRHFADLEFHHLRTEGSGIGLVHTSMMHGEIYYLTGGSWAFFGFKFLHRLVTARPYLLAGLAMLWGFLRCWISRRQRLVTAEEARFYRHTLNRRIAAGLGRVFRKIKPKKEAWSQS